MKVKGRPSKTRMGDPTKTKLPKLALQKFTTADTIKHFLAAFKRIATQKKWPKRYGQHKWQGYLAAKQWQHMLLLHPSMQSSMTRSKTLYLEDTK